MRLDCERPFITARQACTTSALATCQANPAFQEQRHASYSLTQEGTNYLESGSPEAQVFAATPTEGIPQAKLLVCAFAPEALVSSLLRTAYHPILIADWHGLHCAAANARVCGQSGHWSGNEATVDHVGQKWRTATSKAKGTEHNGLNVQRLQQFLCSTSQGCSQLLDSSDFKHDIRTPLQVAEITDGVQKILQSIASGNTEVSIVTTTCKQATRHQGCLPNAAAMCFPLFCKAGLPSNAPLPAAQMITADEAAGGLAQM